ncbi:MAG: 5'/3'-nucleotidase SurE [Rhodospirillales bacterium 12-54-5]|nr:MAG: 5'/3'-nucleotidase SurE [Rhodospirillales bacterium 12-54-5]
MAINLKHARILISNDDGVEAEGIALLERIARTLCDDVWVVAPLHEQSGAGHSLSLHKPLRIRQHGERRFSVDGTPTDAVLLGVMEVMKDKRPDLMLSGINRGSNLAEDVTYSGTVSAAMEATLLEIPSIAFSNQMRGDVNWAVPEHYTAQIIQSLAATDIPHDRLMNVNFPGVSVAEVKGIKICAQGRRKLDDNLDRRVDPQGRPYIWIGGQRTEPFNDHPDSDFKAVSANYIAITPLSLDMTDVALLERMRAAMERA